MCDEHACLMYVFHREYVCIWYVHTCVLHCGICCAVCIFMCVQIYSMYVGSVGVHMFGVCLHESIMCCVFASGIVLCTCGGYT